MNREEHRVMERYAYCLCLHVRPGTIFIGVINLVSRLAQSNLTDLLLTFTQAESLLCGVLFLVALIYQTNLDADPAHPPFKNSMANPHARTASHSLAVVVYMASATVSAMLLYGVVKGRPSYLMPFFWIRLCDFFFSLPTFMATLYANPAYSANSHWADSGNGHHSFSHSSASSPPPGFTDMRKVWGPNGHGGTPSLLVATCVILFKGYFLCVVWKCYRYLKMREMILPLQLSGYPGTAALGHHRVHRLGGARGGSGLSDIVFPPGFIPPTGLPPNPVTINMSPPDYETATKSGNSISAAPPDYETAIRSQMDMKNSPSHQVDASNSSNVASSSSSSNIIDEDKEVAAVAATETQETEEPSASAPVEPSSVTIEETSKSAGRD